MTHIAILLIAILTFAGPVIAQDNGNDSFVAELIAARKPAILIPLPTAADNHQEHNAMVIVNTGAGEILRQNETDGELLAERIGYWYHHRRQLPGVAKSLEGLDHSDASTRIANELIALAGGTS